MKIPGCAVGEHSNEKTVMKKVEQDAASVPQKIDTTPKPIDGGYAIRGTAPEPYVPETKNEEAPKPVEVRMKPKITKSGKYAFLAQTN